MRRDEIGETVRVLIVEDNPSDVRLIRYALAEVGDWPVETIVAEDGEKALAYLRRQGLYSEVRPPHLVILDLNVPKHPGIEVLKAIRGRLEIQDLPVVILSSSPQDVIENTAHDAMVWAQCYLTKPLALDDFLALGKEIHRCYENATAS